ncbi:MAG: glycosyltransferase [Pirellulales bacterium]|nr:glycosyltransferase [Pirellulales bacterium]
MSFARRLRRRGRDLWHLGRYVGRRVSTRRKNDLSNATRPTAGARILFIDSAVPQFDRDAGSRMTFQYLELLVEMGYQVQFLPDDGQRVEPYATLLESRGVEVLAGPKHQGCWPKILNAPDDLACVWLSRPLVAMKYLDEVRTQSRVAVLYSLIDLHYVREARRGELTGNPLFRLRSRLWRQLELSLVEQADLSLSVSETEIAELRRLLPAARVEWLPLYLLSADDPCGKVSIAESPEVLFVGSFRHAPNLDAARWLLDELWPRITREVCDARLHVAGASAPGWLSARRQHNVEIHDSISDERLHALYRRCRVAIVPLRFGAGAKGKTIEAMQRDVPLVSTSFGIEGLPYDENLPAARDDANEFVARVVQLCRDPRACQRAVTSQRQYLRNHFSRASAKLRLEEILHSATGGVSAGTLASGFSSRSPNTVKWGETGDAVAITREAHPMDLDIGVIYTHEREFIGPLLKSMAESGPGLRMRLWLIDNRSDDGAEQWVSLFAHTQVLHNSRRLNYAENLNRVLEAATARYVLLLNTDMVFDPQDCCLARMVAFMDRHPRCGLSTCRLVHPDGSEAHAGRRTQSLSVIAARRFGLGRLSRQTIDHYLCRDHDASESHECDWVSGCFMMLRREVSHEVGPFDTRFGKYFEDVDMALRVRRAGWSVMQNRATKCMHWEQRGSARIWSRDAWRHLRAYAIWLRKWGRAPRWSAMDSTKPSKLAA